MRNRIALACVTCALWGAAACSSNSGEPPVLTAPPPSDGGAEGSSSPDGSSSTEGGATTEGGAGKDAGGDATLGETADADASAGESADADATVTGSEPDADATVSGSEPEGGADAEAGSTTGEPEGGLEAGPTDASIDVPSYCGVVSTMSTSSSVTYVSASLKLSATAMGVTPSGLGYTWSQTNDIGVFGVPADEAAGPSDAVSYMCTAAGTTTISVVVDEGAVPDGGSCPIGAATASIDITCDAYPSGQVEAAWVELGSTGSATTDGGSITGTNTVIARAITGAATCPTITFTGGSAPGTSTMSQRVAAGTIAQRPTVSAAAMSKPSVFPVQTCELAIPSGTTSAVVNAALPGGTSGITLPLPKANAQTILVIGDTGCRMQYSAPTTAADGGVIVNSQWQSCTDPTQYLFGTVATKAASFHPDLVVHVGDYEYRDNECPPDVEGCAGVPWGYGWDAWNADFFTPAAPLLATAPWIVNRGNHEACTRSGQGWYRFLDTNGYDSVTGKDCNVQGSSIAADAGGGFTGDNVGAYNTPYAVQVGSGTQIMVFDSNNIAKTPILPTGANGNMYAAYYDELAQMQALPESGMFNIWTNHHSILGFSNSPPAAAPGIALTSVMEAVYPNTLFPPGTNMALHGHTHLFEALDYVETEGGAGPNDYPATFVSGNAGTLLDTDLPSTLPSPAPDAAVPPIVSDFAHSPGFGFLIMQYQAAGSSPAAWLMTEYDQNGSPLTQCTATMDGQTTCSTWGELE